MGLNLKIYIYVVIYNVISTSYDSCQMSVHIAKTLLKSLKGGVVLLEIL